MSILQQAARRLERLEALDKAAGPLARTVGRAVLAAREDLTDPVLSSVEVHPGATGAAAVLVGVAGIEAAVGVLVLGDLVEADVAPKLARAAVDIARALR